MKKHRTKHSKSLRPRHAVSAATAPVGAGAEPPTTPASSVSAEMWGGYEAAMPSPMRALRFWPTVDARREVDAFDLYGCWTQARSLEANMPEVSKVVQAMVDLMGWLDPLPATDDIAFNKAARALANERLHRAGLFDLSGRLTWQASQEWVERRAIVDGDCLVVLSRAADGGARFAFYDAPQFFETPEGKHVQPGVITNAASRVLYYVLSGTSGKTVYVPAYAAFLYSQKKDPARVRTVSEIAAAINNSSDLQDVQAFTKAGIKFSASYAVVETKDKDAARAEMQSAWAQKRSGASPAEPGAGSTTPPAEQNTSQPTCQPIMTGAPVMPWAPRLDSNVVALGPGRKMEILHDHRPTNETSGFMDKLVATLAFSLGLDPAVVFFPEKLGSASARFTLGVMGRTVRRRLRQRAELMQFMWEHFLACEIAAGRLQPCKAENWTAVRWIPQRDLTIDVGREINGMINASREGLADADRWTMSTEGKTWKEIIADRAENIRFAQALSDQLGVPLSTLLPGAVGSTAPPAETSSNQGDQATEDTDSGTTPRS